jgi:type IV secretion system protein VirB5
LLRRFRYLAAVLALASATPAAAQQIVYDPTNYGQLIAQAQTALKQLQQLQTQVQQGQTLLSSLNTNSGVNGLASLLNTPQLRAVLPDAQIYVSAAQGNLTALGQIGARAQSLRAANRLYTPAAGDTSGQALDSAGDRVARDLALGETIADAGAQRLAGLQQLQARLDTAPDARSVLDLQARLSAEQAMIANDQMRLQGLAMSQAAQDRLAQQQAAERAAAARDARLKLFQAAFQ